MTVIQDELDAVAIHLWTHHRSLVNEHEDYARRLYLIYKKVEKVCYRSSLSARYAAQLANTRRILYWHRTDLERTINAKYRQPNPKRDCSYSYDGSKLFD